MRHLLQKQDKRKALLISFLFGMATALFIFLPFLIVDKGFFLYCGDYNSQQIPFYVHVQQFIKDGGGTWDWGTDLGTSIVNSYSFYNLGSPFLWLTMPFPSRALPYLMVPLFMLKFGCIAAGACLYLLRYAKSSSFAIICSLVYAFCGFNVYNIFFNHMLEPVIYFPLMLWALDGLMIERRSGFFALFVGLALLNSYFFFIGNFVFILLYFIFQCLWGNYKLTGTKFAFLSIEILLGVGLGMALALPSFFNLLGNPRTENFANGMNMILYWHVQQIPAILSSLIVPPDPPYLPNVFTEGAIKWTSMSAFLPIVSVAGVAAYFKSHKGGWLKILLFTSLVMALVPFLNSSFYAFNASYYARWYYMPLLMICLATLLSLQDRSIDLGFGIKFALVLTGLWAILGLLPTQEEEQWRLGVAEYASRFWLTWVTAMLGICIFAVLWHFFRDKKRFASLLLGAVMGFSVFYSVIHISIGKFRQWENDADYVQQQYEGSAALQLPEDEGFYRIDTYSAYDNLGIWLNKSCLQTFNSVVTPSIMEFYPPLGVKRDVSSKPEPQYYALRGLLSTRYTIVPQEDMSAFEAEDPGSLGWHYTGTQGPFAVYENENYLPLGFTYDSFILMDTLNAAYEDDRSALLVRAIGLTREQEEQYGHLFHDKLSSMYNPTSYTGYVSDVLSCRASASYESEADSSGFRVNISLPRENLVFFSVPYDPGFSATVDGREAEVLKVSGGMMAVYAEAGDHEIVFRYRTPGFRAGVAISLVSAGLLALYWVDSLRWEKKRRLKKAAGATAGGAAPPPEETPPENLFEQAAPDTPVQAEETPAKDGSETPREPAPGKDKSETTTPRPDAADTPKTEQD
ncbi:YfhO family protein [Ruminococcaceae bacterium OttesenSCG-928-I18]|nr:YfhO family protein [Ruminococcaceae bacterium OttesenSCG-928-I18]